jgi:hypothetical protein
MTNIQPVSIWINGVVKIATSLDLISINDNLQNSCLFQYFLFDADGAQLITGNITMIGQDYIDYSSSPDSNSYAYAWACTTLNLIPIS